MISGEDDLRFLKEAVPQLQGYLLSNELYWPLSGSLPRLTPGSLLLALARLRVSKPFDAQRLNVQMEVVRVKWRMAWEKKVARELSNRMRLWSQFLSDYGNTPGQNWDSYRMEARGRAILQLLLYELPEPQTIVKTTLADLDVRLRSCLTLGEFIWESELQPIFPKNDFWFLYGNL